MEKRRLLRAREAAGYTEVDVIGRNAPSQLARYVLPGGREPGVGLRVAVL